MKLRELYEAKNHMDETEYNSYKSWKAACKKACADHWIDGDEDIAQAMVGPKPYKRGETKSIGEWDGAVGTVYKHTVKEDAAPAGKFTPPYKASEDNSAGAQGTWCIKDSTGAVVRSGLTQDAASEEVQNMNSQEKTPVTAPGTTTAMP